VALVARAQQAAVPVVGFVGIESARDASPEGFRKGLSQTSYVDGQNVTVKYHYLEGQFDRLPALMADLVRRRVAVIVMGIASIAIAAKAATATIPIVFGVSDDPVKLGLVASLARPGGNATGFNGFLAEVEAKRLALLTRPWPNGTPGARRRTTAVMRAWNIEGASTMTAPSGGRLASPKVSRKWGMQAAEPHRFTAG
jgi:putative ABC transport system substrate-binding protein